MFNNLLLEDISGAAWESIRVLFTENVADTTTRKDFKGTATLPYSERHLWKYHCLLHWSRNTHQFHNNYDLPRFSPPHTSISRSYVPSVSNQSFRMVKRPPAMVGDLNSWNIKKHGQIKHSLYGARRVLMSLVPHFSNHELPLKHQIPIKPYKLLA